MIKSVETNDYYILDKKIVKECGCQAALVYSIIAECNGSVKGSVGELSKIFGIKRSVFYYSLTKLIEAKKIEEIKIPKCRRISEYKIYVEKPDIIKEKYGHLSEKTQDILRQIEKAREEVMKKFGA